MDSFIFILLNFGEMFFYGIKLLIDWIDWLLIKSKQLNQLCIDTSKTFLSKDPGSFRVLGFTVGKVFWKSGLLWLSMCEQLMYHEDHQGNYTGSTQWATSMIGLSSGFHSREHIKLLYWGHCLTCKTELTHFFYC